MSKLKDICGRTESITLDNMKQETLVNSEDQSHGEASCEPNQSRQCVIHMEFPRSLVLRVVPDFLLTWIGRMFCLVDSLRFPCRLSFLLLELPYH